MSDTQNPQPCSHAHVASEVQVLVLEDGTRVAQIRISCTDCKSPMVFPGLSYMGAPPCAGPMGTSAVLPIVAAVDVYPVEAPPAARPKLEIVGGGRPN